MAKRPAKPSAHTPSPKQEAPRRQERSISIWQETLTIIRSERFGFACGLLLLGIAIYLAVAYVGFIMHGANDFSIIESENSGSMRDQIENPARIMGARIMYLFVNITYGLPSVIFIVLLALYGLRLIHAFRFSHMRLLTASAFWLIWASITLGFAQNQTGMDTYFRWGGRHGEAISQWAASYVGFIGMTLVLVFTLLIYLICVNPNTIPTLERWGQRLKQMLKRKPKPQPEEQDTQATETTGALAQTEGTVSETTEPQLTVTEEPTNDNNLLRIIDPVAPQEEEPKGEIPGFTIEQIEAEEPAPASTEDTPTEEQPTTDTSNEEDGLKPITQAREGDDLKDIENPEIDKPLDTELVEKDPDYLLKQLGPYDPRAELSHFQFPSLDLLKVYDNENAPVIDPEEQKANATRIVTTLRSYGVEIESIKATVGPTVTLYEIVPKAGIKISKIQGLENDIMLSLAAMGIRIIAPMPGKGTVGIEVPNVKPQVVSMHSVIASKRFQEEKKMRLPVALGRTITNEVFMFDLAKTPHLIVAGATGQGKSVGLNAIITSLLYKKHPAELKMVLVDPKMVEFSLYHDLLRHYMAAMPDTDDNEIIITDCTKVISTLNSLVIEMENRYKLLMDAKVRNLEDYNDKFINRRLNPEKLVAGELHHQFLPYIVIVIDEYGDFIMQAGKEVEAPIQRITQKARAVGMHMILATQRPSVQIITGVIKANVPSRIAFRCQSIVDSRTVLDSKGAEQLIGRGDLLYSGGGDTTRIQCAFVDTPEVEKIVEHISVQQHYFEPYQLPEYVGEGGDSSEALKPGDVDLKHLDPMFADVARYVVRDQQGSTSNIQRKFQIGYNRAGKLSDQLEAAGIVGPNKGPKGREVLIQDDMSLQAIFERLGVN